MSTYCRKYKVFLAVLTMNFDIIEEPQSHLSLSQLASEYGLHVFLEALGYWALVEPAVAGPLELGLVDVAVRVADCTHQQVVREVPRLDQGDHLGTELGEDLLLGIEKELSRSHL